MEGVHSFFDFYYFHHYCQKFSTCLFNRFFMVLILIKSINRIISVKKAISSNFFNYYAP